MRKTSKGLENFTLLTDAAVRTALVRTACDIVSTSSDLSIDHIIILDSDCSAFETFLRETWKMIHPDVDCLSVIHLHEKTPQVEQVPELSGARRVLLIGSSSDRENVIDASERLLLSSYPHITVVDRIDSKMCRVPTTADRIELSSESLNPKGEMMGRTLELEVQFALVEFKRIDEKSAKDKKEELDSYREQLVLKAQESDMESMEKLLKENRVRAVNYALSLCRDPNTAEDLVQLTDQKAIRQILKLKQPRAFSGWYRKMLYREFLDRTRARENYKEAQLDERGHGLLPAVEIDNTDFQLALRRLERGLPSDLFDVLFWVGFNDLSYSEYAEQKGIPTGTVRSRLHAARKAAKPIMRSLYESLD